jgi:hypothetical protein
MRTEETGFDVVLAQDCQPIKACEGQRVALQDTSGYYHRYTYRADHGFSHGQAMGQDGQVPEMSEPASQCQGCAGSIQEDGVAVFNQLYRGSPNAFLSGACCWRRKVMKLGKARASTAPPCVRTIRSCAASVADRRNGDFGNSEQLAEIGDRHTASLFERSRIFCCLSVG